MRARNRPGMATLFAIFSALALVVCTSGFGLLDAGASNDKHVMKDTHAVVLFSIALLCNLEVAAIWMTVLRSVLN